MFLPRREYDLQVDNLHDDRVGSAIKESKNDWWDQVCVEFMFSGEAGVNETVS